MVAPPFRSSVPQILSAFLQVRLAKELAVCIEKTASFIIQLLLRHSQTSNDACVFGDLWLTEQ